MERYQRELEHHNLLHATNTSSSDSGTTVKPPEAMNLSPEDHATVKPLEAMSQSPDELSCAVCTDLFKNPKLLHCMHSFCEDCIDKMVKQEEGHKPTVVCPICRFVSEVKYSLKSMKNEDGEIQISTDKDEDEG